MRASVFPPSLLAGKELTVAAAAATAAVALAGGAGLVQSSAA